MPNDPVSFYFRTNRNFYRDQFAIAKYTMTMRDSQAYDTQEASAIGPCIGARVNSMYIRA